MAGAGAPARHPRSPRSRARLAPAEAAIGAPRERRLRTRPTRQGYAEKQGRWRGRRRRVRWEAPGAKILTHRYQALDYLAAVSEATKYSERDEAGKYVHRPTDPKPPHRRSCARGHRAPRRAAARCPRRRHGPLAFLAEADATVDVALTKLALPGLDALAVLRQTPSRPSRPRGLLLTLHADDAALRSLIENAADGCILRDATVGELLAAIRAIARARLPSARVSRGRFIAFARRGK